ncbi:MAG TPA: PKD domain-containing protein, partial [Flavobacteriales bacterium]|nr:PKD domain-containing protein [Flavobacteriales bacterium]
NFKSVTISGSLDNAGRSCNDPATVQQIAGSLRDGMIGNWNCGGFAWKVDTGCTTGNTQPGDGVEFTTSTSGCTCSSGYLLRPCIANGNWGGVNSAGCSPPSQQMIVKFEYFCTPTYTNSCLSDDYIDGVTFAGISNSGTGCNGNVDNYIYDTSDTAKVIASNNYNIMLTPTTNWNDGFGVWIDFNNDSDYTDAGEFVYSAAPGIVPVNGNISIPSGATSGLTQMRVRCAYNYQPTAADPCTVFTWGETEDYPILITAPEVSFTVDTNAGCMPLDVAFTNTTTFGNVTSYTWQWGDGTPDTSGVNATHTFANGGSYTVYLNAYDSLGGFLGSYNMGIQVIGGVNWPINVSDTLVCPGSSIWFDQWDYSDTRDWDFGDGNTSTDWYVQHTYADTGIYTVTLDLGFAGCPPTTLTTTIYVTDTLIPNTSITMNMNPACPGKQLNFYPSDWGMTSYAWDFGDGNTSGLTNPYHTFADTGSYAVLLTTTNICGNSNTDTMTVDITDTLAPQNNGFSYYPSSPLCPGTQISFNSSNYENDPSWDFGDGFTASQQFPKHSYAAPGTYVVTHTMTNACGNTTDVTDTVVIDSSLIPNSGFSHSPSPVACPDQPINFYAQEGNADSYDWDFGDGNTSVLQYPFHQYGAIGLYVVSLTVVNDCGNQSTTTDTLFIVDTITLPGSINTMVSPNSSCPGEQIYFDAQWGFPTYVYDYGDGNIDTMSNPYSQHIYSTPGTYYTSQTIMNYCGSDTTIYDTVVINSSMGIPNNVSLNTYPSSVCPNQPMSFYGPYGYASYDWFMGDGSDTISTNSYYLNYSYANAGTYNVAVTITNYCGDDTVLYDSIIIDNNIPVSNSVYISGYPNPACPGETVNITASNGFSTYVWDFGDSSATVTTSNQSVTHQYDTAGVYTTSVTMTNYCGNDTTISTSIQIDTSIQVPNWLSFNVYPDEVCPGQEVGFNTGAGYASYTWDFGDGYTAMGSYNTSYTYDSVGTYNVAVTVANGCGNSVVLTNTVQVDSNANFPSWMNMWFSQSPVCPNELVTLQTYSGYSTYIWDFGNGDSILTTTSSQIDHAYPAAGDYQASVTIVNGCGDSITVYKTIDINNNVSIGWLDIFVPSNPSCPGDDVVISIYGSSNYTYAWDLGDGAVDTTVGTGTTHVYDSVGNYNVVVTATNACGNSLSASKTVSITNNAGPTLYPWTWGTLAQSTIVGCPGDAVTFYFEGIVPDNMWDFGDSTSGVATEVFINQYGMPITIIKHAFTSAGNYIVSLTLTNGCGNVATSSKSYTVGTNLLVDGGLVIEPPTSSSGYTTCRSIGFVAYGGSSYSWDFGDGTTILNSPTPTSSHTYSNDGNYTVSVTITNGCGNSTSYVETMTIQDVGGTVVSATESSAISCGGGADGEALGTVTGGTAPYTYSWDDPSVQSTATATGLSAGTYNVIITDNLGCEGTASATLTDPADIVLSTSTSQASCGSADGDATVSVTSGGISPFTYAWSNGDNTAQADSLSVGTYTVTVSDANGCSSTDNASISENGGGSITVDAITDATCNGDADGAINISISGGTSPYTYLWSNSATTDDITGLEAGSFEVTVTDSAGCQATELVMVSEPDELSVTFTTVDADCGSSNGSATANVTGGTPLYTYQWDANAGSVTTALASSLSANSYDITVSDASGCTTTTNAVVSNNNSPQITITVTDVSCYGAGDGAINTSVTGGTTPYQYIWTWSGGGSTSPNLSGLDAGGYTLLLQDGSGCWAGQGVTITEPDSMVITTTTTNATCNNSDGMASATVSGGISPYSFSWSSGGSSSSEPGLSANSYTLTVTDSNGCSQIENFTIGSGPSVQQICIVTVDTSTSTQNVVVWEKPIPNGIDSFRIYRDILGVYTHIGSVPYADLSEFVDATNGVNPQTTSYRYKVSVIDSCGIESAMSDYHETIHLTVNLGTPPTMNLIWDNYEGIAFAYYTIWRDTSILGNWDSLTSLTNTSTTYSDASPPQTVVLRYMIEVVHPAGCLASKSKSYNSSKSNTTATSDQALGVSSSVTNATQGNCDGVVTATGTGGVPPYTYQWNDPANQTDSTATGLCAGDVTVIVTDALGDTVSTTVTVETTVVPLSGTVATTDAADSTSCTGTATVTPAGGLSPYTYQWNDPSGQTNATAFGLCVGTITCTIIDANGDTVYASGTVAVPVGIIEFSDNTIAMSVFPNPYSGETQIVYSLVTDAHITLEVFNILGERIITLANEQQNIGEHRYEFGAVRLGYPNGIYLVKLTANNQVHFERLVELK